MVSGRTRRNKKIYAVIGLLLLMVMLIFGIHKTMFPELNIGRYKSMVYSSDTRYVINTSPLSNISKTTFPPGSPKRILFYNPVHWWVDWVNNRWESTEMFRKCPVSNCVISRNLSHFNASDAIIFKLQLLEDIPKKRNEQVWIFAQFESPQLLKHPSVFKKYENLVNWTMGYRRDTDLHLSHGYFKTYKESRNQEHGNSLLQKHKLAVGFISHCGASSDRDKYINILKRHIPVDIYGSCGTKSCDNRQRFKDAWNMRNHTSTEYDKCFSMLDSTYKFYLSFENSLCKDYVTEKSLHMVISHKIVPIVRSGGNHSIYHPPHSVINTTDFRNIAELSKYIDFLDKNNSEYLKYFNWRKYYYTEGILNYWNKAFCDICKRLHNPDLYKRLYNDIEKWVMAPGNENACSTPCDIM